ncbi:MAG: phosphate ABC transporter substrate-binding protein PstS, partial [Caldimonas sp.]
MTNKELSLMLSSRKAVRIARAVLAVALTASATVLAAAPMASADEAFVPLGGAGSTWSEIAIEAWKENVAQYALRVNYSGLGSTDGRNQYRNGTVDFAVSEIPYGLTDNGEVDAPPDRKYAYMPVVAGGTAFMYNLKINGTRVTNLRLSGEVVTKIFTSVITKWNDPAILADNPGLNLPERQIIPVVRSDGSGTTAQLTTWMADQYPGIWNDYCARAGRATPCGLTSFFPVASGTNTTALSGSAGVAGSVRADSSEGAITYVEYAYALNANFPVAKLLNQAGYYTEPTENSVAVALLAAKINNDENSPAYLTQQLNGVYTAGDKRVYPLSSYSYMIIPTVAERGFTTAKGYTLGEFAKYFLCEGQRQVPDLGYSPLPINLVEAGLEQVKRIPGVAAESIDISKCNNPTFSSNGTNTLATNAPQPPDCDRKGPEQCTTGTGGNLAQTPKTDQSVNDGDAPLEPGAGQSEAPPAGATGDPAAPAAGAAADPAEPA